MFQPDLLRGKRILITGGGTGLGKAMALRFAALAAEVHICGRREDVLKNAQEEIASQTGNSIRTFVCDVRDAAAVDSMLDAIWERAPLNVLVNNAAGNFIARTEELSPRAWEAVLGIVLQGTLNCTLACGRRWLAAKSPAAAVLNILATYASSSAGSAYVVPSAVAKAGVMALTRSLAVEWGPRGIRMNGIAPGPIPTEGAFSRVMPVKSLEKAVLARNPMRRYGTPEELANLAAFLLSDLCPYVNGDVVTMDGGEWIAGAGEFSALGLAMTDADWESIKPKKKL